jgi:putative transposase
VFRCCCSLVGVITNNDPPPTKGAKKLKSGINRNYTPIVHLYNCSMKTIIHPASFFTATNLNWLPLLQNDQHKQIVLDSLLFLTTQKRVILYAFVIMYNHIHLIWQPAGEYLPKQIQHSFLKYTAQQIKFHLIANDRGSLAQYKVAAADREYQFWERNSLSIELYSEKMFLQKMNYIHNNPVKAGLCRYPEEYLYSSARFYETGVDQWGILMHYKG